MSITVTEDGEVGTCKTLWHEIILLSGSLFYTTSPQGEICMLNQPSSSTAALLGHVTHVPVKEGLHSIIKCLKNQDLTFSSCEFAHSSISSHKKSASVSVFHISPNEGREKLGLSYYKQLNAQCPCVILRLKHYINMFRSLVDHHGDNASINEYKIWSTIKFLKLY
jgi:hypothetical protein